tara:strand:+ start:478 stop:672 length:195 start_codon:yes stop_codon:yes gene_type:complete
MISKFKVGDMVVEITDPSIKLEIKRITKDEKVLCFSKDSFKLLKPEEIIMHVSKARHNILKNNY